MPKRKGTLHIVALGGSIVAPDGINAGFLKRFRAFVRTEVRRGHRFILVTGGGGIARTYQKAARKLGGRVPNVELDAIGTRVTRLNAELVRVVFWPDVHPDVVDAPEKLLHIREPVAIAAGWMPGYSTDTVGVRIAEELGEKRVIIAGSPAYVYERDIRKYPKAAPLSSLTWDAYLDLIPRQWSPGMPAPVDPVAARRAARMGIDVCVVAAANLKNMHKLVNGERYRGTMIS
jgi:uridylate kinase